MKKVLVIDDEEKLNNLITKIISYEGFNVYQAFNCKTAIRILEREDIEVVLCDVKLPDGNGVELVKIIKEKNPGTEVIMLTAYGNIPDGVQAIKNGAFDYITKGDDNEKIIPLIYRAIEKKELTGRVRHLEAQLGDKYAFENIIGYSPLIKNAIELARKVASTDTSVLLTGETGTGKEVFARAIHNASSRKNHNFVAVNCSALNRDLLESEFFGHTAGAFTGAIKEHKGLFEEANRGTIFLDEIGEIAPELQAKLLRVIETGEVMKVGESRTIKVDVRIIAATNRDLHKEMTSGNFREDLFYRISVFSIKLPALRERVEDIEPLTQYFINYFASKANKKINGITGACLSILKHHPWKGNTRELKNIIERCVILAESAEISPTLLPAEILTPYTDLSQDSTTTYDLAEAEKKHIQKVLNFTRGNKTKTAEMLGIALTTLYRKLSEYNIH